MFETQRTHVVRVCTTNKVNLLKSETLKIIQFQQATKNQTKLQNQNHNLFSYKNRRLSTTNRQNHPNQVSSKGGRKNIQTRQGEETRQKRGKNETSQVKANHKKKEHTT